MNETTTVHLLSVYLLLFVISCVLFWSCHFTLWVFSCSQVVTMACLHHTSPTELFSHAWDNTFSSFGLSHLALLLCFGPLLFHICVQVESYHITAFWVTSCFQIVTTIVCLHHTNWVKLCLHGWDNTFSSVGISHIVLLLVVVFLSVLL